MTKVRSISLVRLLVVLLLLLEGSSCRSNSLSEEQAKQVIREVESFPRRSSTLLQEVDVNEPLGREIKRLFTEGYLVDAENGLQITEKGQELVEYLYWMGYGPDEGRWPVVKVWTHQIDVGQIREILIDTKQGTALVTYDLQYQPTPYLEHLNKIDGERVSKAIDYQRRMEPEIKTRRIQLKLWDQGWRAAGEPETVEQSAQGE